jgi:hypothetical protein
VKVLGLPEASRGKHYRRRVIAEPRMFDWLCRPIGKLIADHRIVDNRHTAREAWLGTQEIVSNSLRDSHYMIRPGVGAY